jgi:hypothetical protein
VRVPLLWPVGTRALILASGPSLTPEDVERVRAARARSRNLKVVAVNDTYRLAPWADVLYAADAAWWAAHPDAAEFAGERWTQNIDAGLDGEARQAFNAIRPKLNVVVSKRSDLPSFDAGWVGQGSNSGFQAVNLAVLMGASSVILLGFDMSLGAAGEKHFFGDHPGRMNMNSPFPVFVRAFERSAPVYAQRGIVILNASRRSALKCFRQVKLDLIL